MTPEPETASPTIETIQDQPLSPRDPAERIESIDVLRGVALLGILLMNILEFGLPLGAELNPSIAGGDSGLNLLAWAANHLLFEGKMRAIFSMLFGASAVLITSKSVRRGRGIEVADIYYRRTLWLIAIGLAHAYFIWEGDILFTYGLFGLVLFPLRNLRPWILLGAGLLTLFPVTPGCLSEANQIKTLREKSSEADTLSKSGKVLTDRQQKDRFDWAEKLKGLHQHPEEIAEEYDDHRGGYWRLFQRRTRVVPGTESGDLYRFGVFDALGMMLIGMGLFKLGVFSASLPPATYWKMLAIGYLSGITLNAISGYFYYRSHFDPVYLMYHYSIYQYGRLLVALGHIGGVMLIVKAGALPWFTSRLAAVGRMALTNYIGTSVVCSLIFNGYGLGLFGKFDRVQLLGIVAVIWLVQLILSGLWLEYFRYGPIEWLWRSLTYLRREPIRRTSHA